MAPATQAAVTNPMIPTPTPPTKAKLVCFSFAAYAKTLIDHLRSLNVPILPGLTDPEFSLIESTFRFTFPPDLRSILREGLPVGPHFPNWRSSSPQQLQILLNLPVLNLLKNVSKNGFWVDSWGARPHDKDTALNLARQIVGDNGDGTYDVPALVPVFRNCYIPATCPSVSGNPVFRVDDKGVRVISFDVTRFFQDVDRWLGESLSVSGNKDNKVGSRDGNGGVNVPVWAATAARRVEFWTEVAERGRREGGERERERGGWWWREEEEFRGLSGCLERVYWTLREGGWGEEEVREIMMMKRTVDGCDLRVPGGGVGWHVRVMSLVLLRAGWSMEDVVYSLGKIDGDDDDDDELDGGELGGNKSYLELQPLQLKGCSTGGVDHPVIRRSTLKHLVNLPPLS